MPSADESQSLLLRSPLGLCDLIGLAFRTWRANLKLILRALLLPTVVFICGSGGLQWCISYGITNNSDMQRIAATIGVGFLSLLIYFVGLTWLALRQLALVRLFNGFSQNWEKALAYSRKKTWWAVGLFVISFLLSSVVMGIWICGVVLAGAFSGAGSAAAIVGSSVIMGSILGMIVTISLLFFVGMMGFAILACDDSVSFFGVISEAFRWTFNNFGRVICFGVVFYIVFTAVSMPVSLPMVVASAGDMFFHQMQTGQPVSSDYKISLPIMIFLQFWEGLCSLLLRPILTMAFGLLYLDLRLRVDGLDMTRKLSELQLAYDGADGGIQGH